MKMTILAGLTFIMTALMAMSADLNAKGVEKDQRLHSENKGWKLDQAKITDTSLPRVLLVGDSILAGYMDYVKKELNGKASVDIWTNPYWQSDEMNRALGEVMDKGPYDLVHINAGLHGWPKGRIKDGTFEPLTKAMIEVIRNKCPKSKIIWASSTPVTAKAPAPMVLNPDINPNIVEQNRMAAKVMLEMNVTVNDFYTLLVGKLELARGDQFHWKDEAYTILGKACVESIRKALVAVSVVQSEATPLYAQPVEEVYRKLFELMDLSRPDLAEVKKKVDAGDLPVAMCEYRTVLAKRFAKRPTPRQSYWLHNPADAEKLLDGNLITTHYGGNENYTVPIGKPGNIDFFKPLAEYNMIARDISTMQWVNKYVEAYAKTKDPKYLKAWCDTWNDFALHWDAQLEAYKKNSGFIGKGPDGQPKLFGHIWAEGQTLYLCWRMGAQFSGLVAGIQTADKLGQLDKVEAETIARLLLRMLTFEVPRSRGSLKNAERAVPNQMRGLASAALSTGLSFTEFKEMKDLYHEAIPASLVSYLQDGSDREQSLGYFSNDIGGLIKQIQQYIPGEENYPALIEKLKIISAFRDRFIPSVLRPDGYRPATGSDHAWTDYGKTRKLTPPSTAFTSIFFPYGGYAVQRDGWTPESLYLFMKVTRPSIGHWRPIDNGLQLSAFGRNILVSPVGNLYDPREGAWRMYWESAIGQNTICVDGMSTVERKSDFNKLDQIRWHSSALFDFMESDLAGPFKGSDFRTNGRAIQERRKRGQVKDKPPVTDVVFRRQVHFLRSVDCWIVTDRISSKEAHDYTQSWNYGPEYSENQVTVDKAGKSVVTSQPGAPNLSLFQFGSPASDYRRYFGVYNDDTILGWVGIMKDKDKWMYTPAVSVHVNWKGKGDQLLVSFLRPHKGTDSNGAKIRHVGYFFCTLSDAGFL